MLSEKLGTRKLHIYTFSKLLYEKKVCKQFLRETMLIILAKYLMVPSHASFCSLFGSVTCHLL